MGTTIGSSMCQREQPMTKIVIFKVKSLNFIGLTTTDLPLITYTRLHSLPSIGSEVNIFLLTKFLDDPNHIIVVHCNSGKGRAGTAICAILLFMGYFDNMDDCLRFYGH